MTKSATVKKNASIIESDKSNGSSGLELSGFGNLSSLMDDPVGEGNVTGQPIDLMIDDVEEDPNQPRQTFDEDSMQELTDSIAKLGVMVPISVHVHPDNDSKYVINDGARRYRAAVRAGNKTIAAVVVQPFTLVEQIVVNKVRDDTPAKDKANAFARLMKQHGWTQKQLAAASRLSEPYVSQHMTLLNLPPAIEKVFEDGRCTDVTTINELVKAFKKKPEAVIEWLSQETLEITRSAVKTLRDYLDGKKVGLKNNDLENQNSSGQAGDAEKKPDVKEKQTREADPDKIKKAIVLCIYEERAVRLLLNKRWSAEGFVWIKYEDDGQEVEVEMAKLKLNRMLEA